MRQHWKLWRSGRYEICDAESLAQGERLVLWRGAFGSERQSVTECDKAAGLHHEALEKLTTQLRHFSDRWNAIVGSDAKLKPHSRVNRPPDQGLLGPFNPRRFASHVVGLRSKSFGANSEVISRSSACPHTQRHEPVRLVAQRSCLQSVPRRRYSRMLSHVIAASRSAIAYIHPATARAVSSPSRRVSRNCSGGYSVEFRAAHLARCRSLARWSRLSLLAAMLASTRFAGESRAYLVRGRK